MPTDFKAGCTRPKATLTKESSPEKNGVSQQVEEVKSMIKVGSPAPDFELPAYHQGSFKNFRLSEFKGRWVVLCFYPGDFTFV